MAYGVTAAEIADLITSTLKNLGPPKIRQIAQDLTEYEMASKWFKKSKVVFDSGTGVKETLMFKYSDTARHVGLYEQDTLVIEPLLSNIEIGWVHLTNHYGFERRELLMNRGESKIVNMVSARRGACQLGLITQIEDTVWTLRDPSDAKLPNGLPYYIVKNATEGFNGGNPSGFSTCVGIDSTTQTKWRNYTGTYGVVSKEDLIRKMRKARRLTKFRSPETLKDFREDGGQKWRIYVNEATIDALEMLGEQQNDNLGRDLHKMDEQMTFGGNPIVYVPKLDEDTTNPIYAINHDTFYPIALKGDWFNETEAKPLTGIQHNVFRVDMDLTYNLFCVDRRRNFVLYKA